ncbi:ABC transporter substrate-binding protein [Streptomyces sp. NPDC046261]|uniref:peptide ABC transporter substrate-binding protein n=1 Tax=Streptomyces sp. NPDC046261 TaxID=3157200 RepID=UPI00340CF326
MLTRPTLAKLAAGAAATAAALVTTTSTAAACPPGSGGELRVFAEEPGHLVPGNVNQSESLIVDSVLYSGLVRYDPKTLQPVNVQADSITPSADQKVWTVRLKKHLTFHNGEPVDADAYIRAWNHTAYGPNEQANNDFFRSIQGFGDLQAGPDPDGSGPLRPAPPKARQLSGLKKIDDRTFKVTLNEPYSGFKAMLGYVGFHPMAKACLADLRACDEKPIGNGPYRMEKWEHNKVIETVRFERYAGDKGKSRRITFKLMENVSDGYAAFEKGELDVVRKLLPGDKLPEARQKYGANLIEVPMASLQRIAFPTYDARFKDKRVRQAISMAVDRKAIIDKIYHGAHVPADGFVSPVFPGARSSCAYCAYAPDKARQLLAEAGGWQGGKLELWTNAGADHQVWMAELGEQLKRNLGIDYEVKADLPYSPYVEKIHANAMTGMFRSGWNSDYPSMENFLTPLYGKNGSTAVTGWSDPRFDELVAKGNRAATPAEAVSFYQQAEDLVAEDMPAMPVWYVKGSTLYSDKFTDAVVNPVGGEPILANFTRK